MDGGVWWAAVHGVAKSRTRLSDFTFTFHFHALEKEMAIHSGVLAWRIPGTGEPGGLPSMGSHRVGHDWSDLAVAKALQMVTVAMKLKDVCSLEEKLWPNIHHVKKQSHYFTNKGPSSQSYGFSSSHIWMWELDYRESWAPKLLNCGDGEDSWESLGLQGDPTSPSSWIFPGRIDAEAETPIFWPPDVKNPLVWKDPNAGKDWRREEKGTTEDEMVGWNHLNGHRFE